MSEDTIEITADNDEHYVFSLSEVQTHAHNESAPATPQVKSLKTKNLKRPNSCQVATGIAGVGHSALWSAAAGTVAGPAGIAAGAAAGAFWAALGTQC
ncbi:MAG: hypothetical protein Q3976_08615 [Corynebacterium sp.]|nr:hypothetical protein [Corynebacterium sp.]